MAIKKKPGGKKNTAPMSMPTASSVVTANDNNYGTDVMSKLAGKKVELEYELRDIPLMNIELNPTNEIFRKLDNEDDVRILAEDIQRNGLLHNLVVFPVEERKQEKYMLLSGERRYKALDYLQRQGDAKWNIVKGCRVVVSPLSDNEKKVLLYSANLQVRGGFADESIRRKAVTEFVKCLQQPPYNMSEQKAKAALKEISPQNTRTIDKDWRIETMAAPELTNLLDRKIILRSEMEKMLRLTVSEQVVVAEKLEALEAVAASGLEREKDAIHKQFMESAIAVAEAESIAKAEKLLMEAVAEFDGKIKDLKEKLAEIKEAEKAGNETKVEQIREDSAPKQRTPDSFVMYMKKAASKANQFLSTKNAAKRVAKLSAEEKRVAIEDLEETIRVATELKELLVRSNEDE